MYTQHGHKLRLFTLSEAQFVTAGIITAILPSNTFPMVCPPCVAGDSGHQTHSSVET